MTAAKDPKAAKPGETDEQRERFLAALEAKKHREGHGGIAKDAGQAKGHTDRVGGKREFRRKSGG